MLDQQFYDYLAERMAAKVRECGNKVPVVTGKREKESRSPAVGMQSS